LPGHCRLGHRSDHRSDRRLKSQQVDFRAFDVRRNATAARAAHRRQALSYAIVRSHSCPTRSAKLARSVLPPAMPSVRPRLNGLRKILFQFSAVSSDLSSGKPVNTTTLKPNPPAEISQVAPPTEPTTAVYVQPVCRRKRQPHTRTPRPRRCRPRHRLRCSKKGGLTGRHGSNGLRAYLPTTGPVPSIGQVSGHCRIRARAMAFQRSRRDARQLKRN
jgi:hypothetical protein